jgi:malic enzyme
VAVAVIEQAMADNVATATIEDIPQQVHETMWVPEYPPVTI